MELITFEVDRDKCPYCRSENVRVWIGQGYYICTDCKKLLWEVERTSKS